MMSEKIRVLYYALWIAHPVLQIGIAAFMLQRGLYRKFKYFFGYILVQLSLSLPYFPPFGTIIPPRSTFTGSATL